ncbi:MAG: hypothetical protein V1777_02790 [Candidatus Micrarchaeota archaeon]
MTEKNAQISILNQTTVMAAKQDKQENKFLYFLDDEEQNYIFVRIRIMNDGVTLESFAMMQVSIINQKKHEITRYDSSIREAINVHKWYCKGNPKEFIQKPLTWETLIGFEEEIWQKWRQYLFLYKEKKGL